MRRERHRFECFHYFRQILCFVCVASRETQRNIVFSVSAVCPILSTPYFFLIMRKIRNKIYHWRGRNGRRTYDTSRIIFAVSRSHLVFLDHKSLSLSLWIVSATAHIDRSPKWLRLIIIIFRLMKKQMTKKKTERSCTRPIRLQARLVGLWGSAMSCTIRLMRLALHAHLYLCGFDWTIN